MDTKQFKQLMENQIYIQAGSEMHQHMHSMASKAQKITMQINNQYLPIEKIRELFSELTNKPVDDSFVLFPPFTTDYGQNITIGKGVFINSNCHFQDQGGITIGNNVLIGPKVVIATLNHDFDPSNRKSMNPSPVKIGDNVWIGANVTILPNVTIGENSIIGAGSVVTKDIPSNVVAVGVPAKVIKSIFTN